MNIQTGHLKTLYSFVTAFFPQTEVDKKSLSQEDSEKLIHSLILIIDSLLKSENFYQKKHFTLSAQKHFLSGNISDRLDTISAYLSKFNSRIFNFTRTECQTFIFILENLMDYFKNVDFYVQKRDKKNYFLEYRFWIENFFKIFSQKISGSVDPADVFLPSAQKEVTEDRLEEGWLYSNSNIQFPSIPFALNRNGRQIFLIGVHEDKLRYQDGMTGKEFVVNDVFLESKTWEFLFANFDFKELASFKKIPRKVNDHFRQYFAQIKRAVQLNEDRSYEESYDLLSQTPLDVLQLPLVYWLQIKNLLHLKKETDLKKALSTFTLNFPLYADAYELIGDNYSREENFELAVSAYEKVIKLVQNKRVSEKLRKAKELIGNKKTKTGGILDSHVFDVSEEIIHSENKYLFREKELRQVVEVLLSDSRKNLLIIGDSGIGKTALVRLLARKISSGEIPDLLQNKRIQEVNFVSLLTGSKYRGQFEEKIVKFLEEFKLQNAILLLENIHLMMSTGTARGTSLDLVNILKQFLKDRSVQVIATTFYEEYKNSIEKDNALMAFFQKLTLNELTKEQTREIIENLAKDVFINEDILVSRDIIDRICESAKINIRDRKLPDSAIMVLERCVAKVRYKSFTEKMEKREVTETDLEEVFSDILNLPESRIALSMKDRLLHLKDGLASHIMGQEEALEKISASIITSKLGFDLKSNRPDGVFLFIGPTGVGKTETAIALSRSLYGSDDFLIRIDMSEYMEKFTYSRFVGAAPGYVGYYDANQLTDKIRQNPFSVILLDEIEKADAQLMNIFLQVFDAGHLTDARGNNVDFSHATIIMTSNIGTSLFSKNQLGYGASPGGSSVSRTGMIKMLKKYFSIEFLNRIDEILIFKHLDEEGVKRIIDIQLGEIRTSLAKQDKELVVREDAMNELVRQGYSREYGARNISRVIKTQILEKIAALSLDAEWLEIRTILCASDDQQIIVRPGSKETSAEPEPNIIQQENVK